MKKLVFIISGVFMFTVLNAQMSNEDMPNENETQSFVAVQGFTISSLGDFSEDWDEGKGGYVSYGIIYSNNWSLIFQTGYITFETNDNAPFIGDAKFNMIPLMVGTRYYILRDRFRPFLLAMNGINIISTDYSIERPGIPPSIEMREGTEVKYNFQVGLGLGIIVYKGLEVEFQAKYNSHLLESSIPYNITGTELGVAINWNF